MNTYAELTMNLIYMFTTLSSHFQAFFYKIENKLCKFM